MLSKGKEEKESSVKRRIKPPLSREGGSKKGWKWILFCSCSRKREEFSLADEEVKIERRGGEGQNS